MFPSKLWCDSSWGQPLFAVGSLPNRGSQAALWRLRGWWCFRGEWRIRAGKSNCQKKARGQRDFLIPVISGSCYEFFPFFFFSSGGSSTIKETNHFAKCLKNAVALFRHFYAQKLTRDSRWQDASFSSFSVCESGTMEPWGFSRLFSRIFWKSFSIPAQEQIIYIIADWCD